MYLLIAKITLTLAYCYIEEKEEEQTVRRLNCKNAEKLDTICDLQKVQFDPNFFVNAAGVPPVTAVKRKEKHDAWGAKERQKL